MMMIVLIAAMMMTMSPVINSRSLQRSTWKTPCHGSTPIQLVDDGVTEAPPTADRIRQTLITLERKATEIGLTVGRVKNILIDERLGTDMAELLEQSQVPYSEYPALQPLTVIELVGVINRTSLILSHCFVLLQRAIVYEVLNEARNPTSASLGRIRDGVRDMACLALRAVSPRHRTVDSLLSASQVSTVDAIGSSYDRPTRDFVAYLGSADRAWIDYVLLRNIGRDLEELRANYRSLINTI